MAFSPVSPCAVRLILDNNIRCIETIMSLHLTSSHLVAMIAIALSVALLLAIKFRPATWRGVVCEALLANLSAIAAVVAFEMLTA